MKKIFVVVSLLLNVLFFCLNIYIFQINFNNLNDIPEYKLPDWVQQVAVSIVEEEKYHFKTIDEAQVDFCRARHRKAAIPGLVIDVKPKTLDGDAHITIADGLSRMVFEIDKRVPLVLPRVGDYIVGFGMVSFDEGFPCGGGPVSSHGWFEINPLVQWARIDLKNNKVFTLKHSRLRRKLYANRDGRTLK